LGLHDLRIMPLKPEHKEYIKLDIHKCSTNNILTHKYVLVQKAS
jgi:hypothetical protein